ncbi:MAG: M42 family metallopeptidase [Clostridia bacterium]|nr:M42 family metallopeptidase [Clostridia bacterium]
MELLKKLTQCSGASGREEKISELIETEIKPCCDECYTDALGNLIARKGSGGKKILVCAHMDEIGIVVTFKDEKGFLRFAPVGGLRAKDLMGRRVVFADGTVGVIGVENGTEKYTVQKMFIDTGNKGDIKIGDMGVFVGDFYEKDGAVISKALDNRGGCYVAIEAMKQLKNTENEIYFMFTVQEEVGLRGAKTVAYNVPADYAIAVDVTDVGDTPSDKPMAVKLGGGAAVKVMDRSVICHSEVRNKLIEIADKNKIPYQLEVLTAGGTDAGAVHTTGSGIKTGAISIPTRYIHSPSEMADKNDIECCIRLLCGFLENA